MILGRFQRRGHTIEAESAVSDAGEVVWLHRLAQIELEAAYKDFREAA